VGTLLLTATGVLTEIQSALNAIWKAAPLMGLLELVRARLLSLRLIVTLGFLMLVSLVVNAGESPAARGSFFKDHPKHSLERTIMQRSPHRPLGGVYALT
jgi:uncharacterized BrkB/YihY/UPF0761 family membrane protein